MKLDRDSFYRITLTVFITISIWIIGVGWYYAPSKIPRLGELEEQKELSSEDYVEDFQFVVETIEKYYPFLEINKEINKVDWLGKEEEYRGRIEKCKTDNDFYKEMQTILMELNNGHTHLLPEDDISIEFYSLYRRVYRNDWKIELAKRFEKPLVQNRYKLTNEKIDEILEKEKDMKLDKDLKNIEYGDLIDNEIGYIHIKSMVQPHDSIPSFRKEKVELTNYIKTLKNHKAILLDIRGNGGGNPYYWSGFLLPLIVDKDYSTDIYSFTKEGELLDKFLDQYSYEEFTEEELGEMGFPEDTENILKEFSMFKKETNEVKQAEESIEFKGRLYLLVDDYVFSASEMMASFVKETGLATLVGERTGGDGIASDPMLIDLPNSGYILRFSKELGVLESGSINERDKTVPDIIVEDSKKKVYKEKGSININGDSVVKKLLEIEKNKSK